VTASKIALPASSRPVSPAKRLSSAVYDEIKARILDGDYKPGDWLAVDALCDEFQVSRQPVMEALRRLSGEWLVVIIPQVGCRVTTYEPQAFRDFLATFGEMEAQLGALAAERRTDEQLDLLEGILGQLRKLTHHDAEYRSLTRDFHSTILDMAHSELLARLCEQMWDFGEFVFSTVTGSPNDDSIPQTLSAQIHLVEAIRTQNQALAKLHTAVWLMGVLATVP
jgi:DNA-binding GntR family transcriptional regulator